MNWRVKGLNIEVKGVDTNVDIISVEYSDNGWSLQYKPNVDITTGNEQLTDKKYKAYPQSSTVITTEGKLYVNVEYL